MPESIIPVLSLMTWLAALAVAVPVAVLAVECAAGTWVRRRPAMGAEPPPYLVLMPAHDEAAGIARAVTAVLAQLRPCDRLLVIADNCSDATAFIAAELGADVIERDEPRYRGKGHALEYGRAAVGDDPAQVIVVVDADCLPHAEALPRLVATAARRRAVVQGAYLLAPRRTASAVVRVSCFAFLVKNRVRQLGLQRLAGAALLQGSGMAFPREVFAAIRWRPDSLVEDLEMGLDLLLGGHEVLFEHRAGFVSMASSRSGTESQRQRWEHGMLQAAWSCFPRLLEAGLRGRPRLLMVALDLLVPPTALLALEALAMTTLLLALLGLAPPVIVLLLADLALALALFAAWLVHGRDILPPASLLQVPAYLVWKLPMLARFVTQREREWVRTERE
ncbi:MAG: glycosyltransferase family 2 protein [Novosphingobium sp.]